MPNKSEQSPAPGEVNADLDLPDLSVRIESLRVTDYELTGPADRLVEEHRLSPNLLGRGEICSRLGIRPATLGRLIRFANITPNVTAPGRRQFRETDGAGTL